MDLQHGGLSNTTHTFYLTKVNLRQWTAKIVSLTEEQVHGKKVDVIPEK